MNSNPLGQRRTENIDRIRAASETAASGGKSIHAFTRVLAEFLAAAEPRTANWWRPAHDPEPGQHVVSVYSGTSHYVRADDGWLLWTFDGKGPKSRWAEIPATLVVDTSRAKAGSYKINNPAPAEMALPDWQATTPGEVLDLLRNTIQVLESRLDAGGGTASIATRWVPDDFGPIALIRIADDDEAIWGPITKCNHQ